LWVDAITSDIDLPSSRWLPLDDAVVAHLLGEADQQVPAQVSVADLAAAELASDLDPVAVLEELDGARTLCRSHLTDLGLKPDLLEINGPLMTARFLLAAGLLVLNWP
jgi:hypothetical protein